MFHIGLKMLYFRFGFITVCWVLLVSCQRYQKSGGADTNSSPPSSTTTTLSTPSDPSDDPTPTPTIPSTTTTTLSTPSSPTPTPTTTTTTLVAIQTPGRVGQIVSDCQTNASYDACIYKKSPVSQENKALDEPLIVEDSINSFYRQMRERQTYGIKISDATDNQLKNKHYDVQMEVKDANDQVYPRLTLTGDKWTTPYKTDWDADDPPDFSVEQVMTYHYLMYQKEWLELNAGKWYASDENITVIAFGNQTGAYWTAGEEKLVIGREWNCRLEKDSACNAQIGLALSGGVVLHEAGHANIHYANESRSGSLGCQKHKLCGTTKSICEDVGSPISTADICCDKQKGCYFAINEGQADFHIALLFKDSPQASEFYLNDPAGGGYRCGGSTFLFRNPKQNHSTTISDVWNCSTDNQGQVHLMGLMYNSIWYTLYTQNNISPRDIARLFTEHLPLLDYSDDFEMAGAKIINLAKQMWQEDGQGDRYAQIIENEFVRRGLNPLGASTSYSPSQTLGKDYSLPSQRLTHPALSIIMPFNLWFKSQ